MKKLLILITILIVLGITVSTVLAVPNHTKEPLDKITFIHYRDGRVKPIGALAKAATCYKLLGVKWKSLPVSYVIDPSLDKDAIITSTDEWDGHTSASLFDGYTIDSANFDDSPDGKNEYSYGNYPEAGVIAVTRIWYTRIGRAIVEYDVMFDTDYEFVDCTKTDCTTKMDLRNIATHETGHGIGLGDIYSSVCSAVTMYGYSWYGDIDKRTLEQPDITGLQRMYGV